MDRAPGGGRRHTTSNRLVSGPRSERRSSVASIPALLDREVAWSARSTAESASAEDSVGEQP